MNVFFLTSGRKRKRKEETQLVVQDAPTFPPKKEVSFVEQYPDTLYATKYSDYDENYVNNEDDNDDFYRPQIPSHQNHFGNDPTQFTNHDYYPEPVMKPDAPPEYIVADKWDPYDSEDDVPLRFAFEGNGPALTPANSLSSLASTHMVI